MTGRERLQAILDGRQPDRLPWTTLVDGNTLNRLPEPLRGMGCLDFYRHVGCDVVQLGGWGTPHQFASPRLVAPGVENTWSTDAQGNHVMESRCPRGMLRTVISATGHPLEYPVKTVADVRLLRERYEATLYEAADDTASYAALAALVGDDGIITHFSGTSAIPLLLENLIGIEQFYYLLDDEPAEMEGLIAEIQRVEKQHFALIADHPAPVGILVENTSTRYIGPEIYARYNLPSQRAYVEALHARGKTAILHMCGHVGDLLPLIKDTGCDGIHALTPPPLGDCPWEKALDILGDDLIIMSCLPVDRWLTCPLDEIAANLDQIITPRIRDSRFILGPFADGIAVDVERFKAIGAWVEQKCKILS